MARLLVDAMNAVGSRPDGWWRDRDAALRRLVDELARLTAEDELTAVLDGRPLAGLPEGEHGGVRVLYGASADDRIVDVVREDADPESLVVVTADQELRGRVTAMGAGVLGPRSLLGRLEASSVRGAREVVEDHLELAKAGEVERDLERNYDPDVRIFIADGVHRGHDGARELAERLERELPSERFTYTTVLVEGDVGFLEWTGESESAEVRDGADSFVVRDGRIVAQTIHYTVVPRSP
jgi:predicted RNA-binding protein with PIN domain